MVVFIDLLQCSIDPNAQTSQGIDISNIFTFATKSCVIRVSGGDLIDFEADDFLNFTVSYNLFIVAFLLLILVVRLWLRMYRLIRKAWKLSSQLKL